jgi:lysophospholipid acyltransferase (LPLAT)-like uncharacterized protein
MGIQKYKFKKELKFKLIGLFGKLFIDLLFSTMKIDSIGFEKVEPIIRSRRFVAAIWHSRILIFPYLFKGLNGAIMVSRSQDGELIARVLDKQGHETIRGSSRKGGIAALAKLIENVKTCNRPGIVVPDGPQGPRFHVQPGVVMLAKQTGYPILTGAYSAKTIKVFGSWDRFILPYPFTTCRVVYGNPIYVPPDADSVMLKEYIKYVEEELRSITLKADNTFGHRIK